MGNLLCNQCCSCPAKYQTDTSKQTPNEPYLYSSCTSSSQPFGYQNSDLKNLYLTEHQLQCRLVTPVLSQEQLLQQQYKNFN